MTLFILRGPARRNGLPTRRCRRASCPAKIRDGSIISTEAIQGIGFQDMVRHQLEAAEVVRQDPAVSGFTSYVGPGPGGGGMNTGRINIDLKPREERDVSVDQVIARLRPKLAQIRACAPT